MPEHISNTYSLSLSLSLYRSIYLLKFLKDFTDQKRDEKMYKKFRYFGVQHHQQGKRLGARKVVVGTLYISISSLLGVFIAFSRSYGLKRRSMKEKTPLQKLSKPQDTLYPCSFDPPKLTCHYTHSIDGQTFLVSTVGEGEIQSYNDNEHQLIIAQA